MDHHRLRLFGVLVDIEGAETFRQVEVHLRRAALPFTTDGILQRIFELWPVESALARQNAGLDAAAGLFLDGLQNLHHDAFGTVPEIVGTDTLFRAGRKLDDDLAETEILIDREDQVVDAQAFRSHLLFRAEDMRIVLREAANAHQAMQCT